MADEQSTEEENPSEAKPNGSKRFMIIGIISMVVVVETLLFFFLVPSAEEVAALAESRLIEEVESGKEEKEEKEDEENKVIEQPLGVFGETFSPLGTEQQYRTEFRLFGTLRKKNEEQMSNEFQAKEGRLRHSIRMVMRNARLEELQENQLGLIERRILATCNNLLDEPILLSVGLSDFQFREE